MDFYQRLELVGKQIPKGFVTTYGQLALLCGKPGNARQVGYALREGRAGKEFPAFRVVNAKGILSGAAAFESPDLQRLLLETEGVELAETPDGWRVDLKRFGWKPSMEEAELLYEMFLRKEKEKKRQQGERYDGEKE